MQIGIAVGDLRGPANMEELTGQVRTAADAGFSTAWSAQAFGWDALTALAVAGSQVPKIGLGSAVIPIPQRHPLVLASQALSVQAASGNRLSLGIGAGIAMMLGSMFGLPSAQPVRRMREYLTVLRPLLRGENVSFHGETLTAAGSVSIPGAEAPDVLVAALGPAMLGLAGELADGAVTWMAGLRTLASHIVPTVTKAAEAAGRRTPRVVAGVLVCVTDKDNEVRERIARQFALAGRVPEYRAVLDREGASGPQDVAITGTDDVVARHLARLAEAGITDVMATPFGTAGEQRRTTEVLAALASHSAPVVTRS
jgi:F420-dependent oxidoreductase-like protein